jgi:hypothetical protein
MMRFGTMLIGVVFALAVPAGVAAADPPGSRDLAGFPAEQPQIELLGASSYGVLYVVRTTVRDAEHTDATWVKPATGPAYRVGSEFTQLAGDKIYAGVPGYQSISVPVRYQVIGRQAVLRCDDSPQPAGRPTPSGWISESGARVAATAAGCRVTVTDPPLDGVVGAADAAGYVMLANADSDGRQQLTYRSYAAPNRPHVIADGGKNRYVTGLTLAGSVVTWAQADYDNVPLRDTSYLVRSSTDGSTAPVVTFLERMIGYTAILGDLTAWSGCYHGDVDPRGRCGAGTVGPGGNRTEQPGTRTVFGVGSRFVFDTYGTSPGLDTSTTMDAGASRSRLVTVGLLPPVAYTVSIGAGGAAYVDSQGPARSVSRRAYSRSGATLMLHPQVALAGQTAATTVSRDGRRTAYLDAGLDLWLVTDDGLRTRIFDSVDEAARVDEHAPFDLSGTRLLWTKVRYTGEFCEVACQPTYGDPVLMMYDLRTGASRELMRPPAGRFQAALWGSYIAYQGSQNSIYRRDLSSGRTVQAKAPGTASLMSLAVHGDYVGWTTCVSTPTTHCAQSVVGYRNVSTGTAAVQVASSETRRVELSGGHLMYDVYPSPAISNGVGTIKVLRLGTTVTGTVGQTRIGQPIDVHDEILTWIDPDARARIGPNSAFVAPPRYLGNAIGATSLTPNGDGRGDSWQPEFSISKALPVCAVTITSGSAVRRVLSCATSVGSARVAWNGRDSAGRVLPKGRYTWTLTGRDADGPLRWWTGVTSPIRGTITIT